MSGGESDKENDSSCKDGDYDDDRADVSDKATHKSADKAAEESAAAELNAISPVG